MKKFYICSDIHGFYNEWQKALIDNEFDIENKDHILVICGDLFDRGNQAVECYNFVKQLNKQNRLIYIKGNHEDLIFDCVQDLNEYNGCASSHHYSNGTVNTCVQFMEEGVLEEVLQFIDNNAIDYYELGKYIFVHSYIPVLKIKEKLSYNPNWRTANKEDWKDARWGNPFELYRKGIYEPDKIIVSGHWHCSWWHSHIEQKTPEFPKLEDQRFDAAFKPVILDNFIGIDACTAYSKKVNVLLINEDEIGDKNV